ncbi:TetR/AcrR family transcriptional regulator [Jiangella mangrovi]|uniref:AcrR family transcriptional regulator n=1 Tax=Jiangella mangrovi TaxID=1524084 RepID=A0A7W9GV95_9ACTN|nr:TetR/AcrR family transcriptional regulator [Jiangella mangrovi]MBB5790366.1 AcrR family transcriptional regulator [Jiangella mangrovi]
MTTVRPAQKRLRTRARIAEHALDLFERQGFEATTITQIAAAAGVTEMTVFRHFSSKEQLLLDDPYDPVIAAAVGAQPLDWPPIARAIGGLRSAWEQLPEPEGETVRRRVRVVAEHDILRAAAWRTNATTERLISAQLIQDGAEPLRARVASGAILAALMAALYEWAGQQDRSLADAVMVALSTLEGSHG